MGRHIEHANRSQGLVQVFEPGMHFHGDTRPVIEAGPLQVAIRETKAEGFDQVQRGVGGRAGSCNIAGILRDFRLIEHDLQKRFVIADQPPAVVAAAVESCLLFAVAWGSRGHTGWPCLRHPQAGSSALGAAGSREYSKSQ